MKYIFALIFGIIITGVIGLLTLFFVFLANHKNEIWNLLNFKGEEDDD